MIFNLKRTPYIGLLCGIFICFQTLSFSQALTFQDQIELPGISDGSAGWGDFDQDGDLDFLITGSLITKIFTNQGNNLFSENTSINLIGLAHSTAKWCDFDKDGDLDIFLAGTTDYSERFSGLYVNSGNGDFSLLELEIFEPLSGGDAKWADLDNDGNIDLIYSGEDYKLDISTLIYWNNGVGFERSDGYLRGAEEIDIADINGDGLLDIGLSGRDINGNGHSTIMINYGDRDFLTDQTSNLAPTAYGSFDFGDYDADGDPDLIITGSTTEEYGFSKIYRNEGNQVFVLISTPDVMPVRWGSCKWIDYNNDGRKDILVTGMESYPNYKMKLYENTGNDTFSVVTGIDEQGYQDASQQWADYDGDGDRDLLIAGQRHTRIYCNNSNGGNTPPGIPSGLNYKVFEGDVHLNWEKPLDTETPSDQLTYNLVVGISSNGNDIVSPGSGYKDGNNILFEEGSISGKPFAIVKGLEPGVYYWKVQAIDNSLMTSYYSQEMTFEVLPTFTEEEETGFEDIDGSGSWGDYDSDGYLDVILIGCTNAGSQDRENVAHLYKNNIYESDSFQLDFQFSGDWTGNASWGDTDNDGDLDLIIFDNSQDSVPNIRLYRNDNAESFTELDFAENSYVSGTSGTFGDFDNDGDLDLVVGGMTDQEKTIIFENSGSNTFLERSDIILFGTQKGSQSWIDYDKDGDLDLFLTGGNELYLYKNNGEGIFVSVQDLFFDIPGSCTASWGDYDNDGDLDLAVAGGDYFGGPFFELYRNDSNEGFTRIETNIRKVAWSMVQWGDYNNDGYLDIVITGFSSNYITRVYRNNQRGGFEELPLVFSIYNSDNISWGDYDSDGDLDLLRVGGGFSMTYLYRNNSNFPNFRPTVPTILETKTSGLGMVLSWDPAEDPNLPGGKVYYNIRVGTTPGGIDVVSPMSNLSTGELYLPNFGNAQCDTFWILKGLVPGRTYYWSVQAIDQSFKGGGWADEMMFEPATLVADFESSESCKGSATSFIDRSTAFGSEISTWHWDFGDGNSTDQNPRHVFSSAGIHNVTLTVTAGGESFYKTGQVLVLSSPEANFDTDDVCLGEMAVFQNTSATNGLGILNWNWDFGDGITSPVENPQPHGFIKPVSYNVQLIVEAENGCSDTLIKVVTALSKPEKELSTEGTPCIDPGFMLKTTDSPSYSYQWKYQGTVITDANQSSYQPDRVGDYSVVVTSLCGEVSATYSVEEPSISIYGEGIPCEGSDYVLKTLDRESYSYQWKVQGIDIDGANDASHHPAKPGEYSVAVQTPCGEFTSSYNVGFLVGPPKPDIHLRGPEVWYLACSNDSADIYQWYWDGILIENADGSVYVPNQQLGEFQVRISDGSECFTYSDPVYLPGSFTDIADDPFSGLNIYPNPTPGLFIIEIDNQIMGDLFIDIFSEQGSKILNIKFLKETSHFEAQVDLSGQPVGLYLIGLRLSEFKTSRKIVIE